MNATTTRILKRIHHALALLIIATNFYFIPLLIRISITQGGAFGLGLLLVPFLFTTTLFLIPALYSFKYHKNSFLFILNFIGAFWNVFWLWLFLSTPKMD